VKTDRIIYTMVDVTPIGTNSLHADSYRITLSRGGVNGGTDSATIDVGASALETFVHRAAALLLKSGNDSPGSCEYEFSALPPARCAMGVIVVMGHWA
jgi:hypothetical protein